jgi:hypothetical protein
MSYNLINLNLKNMKKTIWIGMLLLVAGKAGQAQDMVMVQKADMAENRVMVAEPKNIFEFIAFTQADELGKIKDDQVAKHFLGDEIARKLFLFNGSYSYKEPVAPGNSATKTIFRKPVIYNSVKKIEHTLKSKVKSGDLSVETARAQFNKVLDVAINIININTDSFEDRLASAGNTHELLDIYIHEVRLRFVN